MSKLWIRATLGLSLCLGASLAHAQAGKMYGSVTDGSGQGVTGVKITLSPVEDGAKVEVLSKGKKGSYFFGLIRPGTYELKVESAGNALISVKALAKMPNVADKDKGWSLDGKVSPDKPVKVHVEDAMDISCDLVVGPAVMVQGPGGGTTAATPDQAYLLLAKQVQAGDCAGALPQIDAFTTSNPTYARAFYLKGFCDAVLEHDDAAVAAIQKSIELDPTFAGSETLLGKVYVRQGKAAEAELAFRKELENTAAAPEVQIDALLSLGSVLRDQKKTDDAIASFEKVIALAPSRPEPYIELSGLYSDSGHLDKAEAILTQAKQAGADDPAALLHVGISFFNKKDLPHAEAMCRRVIEGGKANNSDLASAYAILGRVQLNNGKKDDGVASLKKSTELDPGGRFASQNDELLKALKVK